MSLDINYTLPFNNCNIIQIFRNHNCFRITQKKSYAGCFPNAVNAIRHLQTVETHFKSRSITACLK